MSQRDEILESLNALVDNAEFWDRTVIRDHATHIINRVHEALPETDDGENGSHFVVFGGPVEGFEFIGPFADFEKATRWGEMNGGMSWWIIQPEASHPSVN